MVSLVGIDYTHGCGREIALGGSMQEACDQLLKNWSTLITDQQPSYGLRYCSRKVLIRLRMKVHVMLKVESRFVVLGCV